MTTQTILLLMAVGAIVVGFGAAHFELSPWRVFGVAWIPTAIVLVLVGLLVAIPGRRLYRQWARRAEDLDRSQKRR